jgi:hypothetical protein
MFSDEHGWYHICDDCGNKEYETKQKDCACVDTDAHRCVEKRYGYVVNNDGSKVFEKCECPCHTVDDEEE